MSCSVENAGYEYLQSTEWQNGLMVIFIIASVSTILTINLMYSHFQNYSKPKIQRPITRIILMVPLYSLSTFISFIFVNQALYIQFARDAYEGLVVYNFHNLFLEYLGTNDSKRKEILSQKSCYRMPPPACLFFYDPKSPLFLTLIKCGGMKD